MFLLRMMLHSVLRNKRQSLLIGLTTVIGITLSVSMLSLMVGIQEKVNMELKSYGANIKVTPKSTEIISDLYGTVQQTTQKNSFIDEKDIPKVKAMFWGFNILDVSPYLQIPVTIQESDKQVDLTGSWFNKKVELTNNGSMTTGLANMKKWWEIKGKWLEDADKNGVLVGSSLAQKYDWEVGSPVEVQSGNQVKRLIVRGIFHSGDDDDNKLFSNLDVAQELSGNQGKVDSFDVSALTTPDNDLARKAAVNPNSLTVKEKETWYCTAYASSISYQIQEVIPNVVAKPIRKIAESEGKILEKNKLLLLFFSIISVIGAAVGAANLISATLMERNIEVGIKEALGISTPMLFVELLSGVFIINFVAGGIGFILGQGMTQFISYLVFNSGVPFSILTVPLTIGLILFISIIGSIPTIHYLLTFKPADVLHGRG